MKIRYFVLILSLIILPLLIISGDEEIARALIKKGDESFQKNEISKAIELYKKALKEYSNLPEAYLKLGNAYIKTGDKRNARRNFETCIKLVKESSNPSATLQNIQKEANNKLSSLDKNRQEFITLEKKYVADLLSLSRRTLKKDIPLTETILKTILYLDPANSDVSKLFQELKQLKIFDSWKPIFNGEDLIDWEPEVPSLWKVEDNILICDPKNSAPVNHRKKLNFEKVYKLLMEFKIDELYNEGTKHGCVGVILGWKGNSNEMTSISVFEDETKLIGFIEGKGNDIKNGKIPDNFKISEWNTLVLDISYTTLKCYLNDILVLEHRADKEDFFWGGSGLWIQRAKTQIKKIQYLQQ